MKKQSRALQKNGDTARPRAQAKAPSKTPARRAGVSIRRQRALAAAKKPQSPNSAKLARFTAGKTVGGTPTHAEAKAVNYGTEIANFCDHRLFRNGRDYYLVTDYGAMHADDGTESIGPGQTVRVLTRDEALAWVNEKIIGTMVPYEFRHEFHARAGTGKAIEKLTLGELLERDAINALNRWADDGIPILPQVAGAVNSWLSFAEHMSGFPDGTERIKATPGILDCHNFEFAIARERAQFVSQPTAEFFRGLVVRARAMPLKEAADYLDRLHDLIEYHPGFADERQAIRDISDGNCNLGKSAALSAVAG